MYLKTLRLRRKIRANLLYEAARLRTLIKHRFIYDFGDPAGGGRKRSSIPKECPCCGWIGLEKESKHGYRKVDWDDVEAVDYCPECGAEEPSTMKTVRSQISQFTGRLDVVLAPYLTNGRKSLRSNIHKK